MVRNTNSEGVGVGSLLLVAFIVLKLTNTINWSWWWVLSPIWIPLVLVVIGFFIGLIFLKR